MKFYNISKLLGITLLLALSTGCKTNQKMSYKYNYETVENDPLGTKIYTLKNGLKVYMSVYKDAPRIQTYVATRAGSKNDPADATGLAHYLEHMLFKGSSKIGALDWEKEKVLLKEISDLYEEHFKANPEDRKKIYEKIDAISFQAAKLVASNEYDKMISSLGAKGTNAYTSLDQTVYVNDIPSNELERWLKVESERFGELVLRLFHTELETVYEEFNIGQNSDGRKVFQAFMSGLLPQHPYGTQTTIGTGEHLKRPSMVKIHQYFQNYYVPNNMAIVLAGDFDPDKAIEMIEKYFGSYKTKEIPKFEVKSQPEIKEPVVKEVFGIEKSVVDMGWRLPGAGSEEAMLGELVANILSNDKAGLVDINLVQKQLVGADSYTFCWSANDFSFFGFYAIPRPGQKLEELKDLFLLELDKVRKGEFEDWMIEAVVTDLEYKMQKSLENNQGRAQMMLSSFIANQKWANAVSKYRKMRAVTKEQVMEFVDKHLKTNNFAVVYKREGEDKDIMKVEKPKITPVEPPKDTISTYRVDFEKMQSPRTSPVFVDFKKSILSQNLSNGVRLDYIKNENNQTFELNYVLDMGSDQDKVLPIALRYLKYLGTDKYSPEQLQQEFFKLGVSFDIFASNEVTYVTLRGLDRSIEKGIELFEHILANAEPNAEALKNMVAEIKKERADAKKDKRQVLQNAMFNYARYGKNSPFTDILSNAEMDALSGRQLVNKVTELCAYKHDVFYFGSLEMAKVAETLNKLHKVSAELKDYPKRPDFKELDTKDNKVVFVSFPEMTQAEIMMVSKGTEGFDLQQDIMSQLYNEYFGSGLSSVVFQEIREKRALAYSAYAFNTAPRDNRDAHYFRAYVGTQADKIKDAVPAMNEIVNNMPITQDQIVNAVEAIIKKTETDRMTRDRVYWTYRANKKRGYEKDLREDSYQYYTKLSSDKNAVTAALKSFQEKTIKDRKYTILVLGDKKRLDMNYLKSLGQFEELTLEQVFGY
jgi:predicted Zn-dependent peptidase